MALVALPGAPFVPIGPGFFVNQTALVVTSITMDAANEASIYIGYVCTSDGGSHTIDTTGSSSLGWRTGTVTFSNAGTTVKVGLAAVLTTAGTPARAANASDVITFDVSKSLSGGGGGITGSAWQTHVPDTGSKTIAHGDLVAFCVQMTARGGSDTVDTAPFASNTGYHRPTVTQFVGAAYSNVNCLPNAIITFSDGALGFFQGSEIGTPNGLVWNNTSSPKEYGQLYDLPFPLKIYGLYCWATAGVNTADFDLILYSNPLVTPVAEKTISIDANTIATPTSRKLAVLFPSPYTTTANEKVVAAIKPTSADNVSAYSKTLASATHRVTDPFGTSGYAVQRSSGAFANLNSSLDHIYIGLVAGAFDAGGTAGRAVQVNNDSLVS